MAGGAEELVGLGLELFHADVGERRQHPAGKHLQLAVITVIVLGDHVVEPPVVLGVGGLPGLTGAQGLILFGHDAQAAQDEVELDRRRLLTPQGAVVVEDRDPVLRWDFGRHPPDSTVACLLAPSRQLGSGSPVGAAASRA
jgi:hypothetical protein